MPNLKDFYLKLQQEKEKAFRKPGPEPYNPASSEQEIFKYYAEMYEAYDREQQIKMRIVRALRERSDEELKTLYQTIKVKQENPHATVEKYVRDIRDPATPSIFPAKALGTTLGAILDAYETFLGEDKVREIVEQPLRLPPMDPEYNESRVDHPYEEQINALTEKFTQGKDEAGAKEIRELMEKVNRSLEQVKPEILEAYHMVNTKGIPDLSYPSPDSVTDKRGNLTVQEGLELLGNGEFKDVIQPQIINELPTYSFVDTEQYVRPLSEEDQNELLRLSRNPETGLSGQTRQALSELEKLMNGVDYTKAESANLAGMLFPPRRPMGKNEQYIMPEEKRKYYAFYPLMAARQDLASAVVHGDLDEIRAAQAEYDKVDASLGAMMDTLKSKELSDQPLFSANVESTRGSTPFLPEKYALDPNNQKKLNSVFVGYAALKNSGIPLSELANDPAGTMIKLADSLIESNGFSSRPDSIGAALQNGLKVLDPENGRPAADAFDAAIAELYRGMSRGLAGVAGLEKDPKRRAEFRAAAELGMRVGMKKVLEYRKNIDLAEKIATGREPEYAAMRGVLYQNAALLPEKGALQFNLEKIIGNFSKSSASGKSWKNDQDRATSYASGMMPVDFGELAGRNQKLIQEAREEQQRSGIYDSGFDPDLYLINALSAQARLAANVQAAPNDAKFRKFQKSIDEMWKLAENPNTRVLLKLGSELMKDPKAYNYLNTDKSDQIWKSDSKEYSRMKQSLAKLRNFREILQRGDPKELEQLRDRDFCKELEQAKQDAFTYVRLKHDNGRKTDFHYGSGMNRVMEGWRTYDELAKLQDALNLRSDAQKLYENTRRRLLMDRCGSTYKPEDLKRDFAKMLYAKSVMDAGIPPEKQSAYFTQEKLGYRIKNYTEKLEHYKGADLDRLAESALKGNGLFRKLNETLTEIFSEKYQKALANQPEQISQQDFRWGCALDLAAEELKINSGAQNYTEKNAVLVEEAGRIMKQPEFQEVTEMLMRDKSPEELRKLHVPGKLDNRFRSDSTYQKAQAALRYEKVCAAAFTEAKLRREGIRNPDPDLVQQQAEELRKNKGFQACVQEKLGDFRNRNRMEIEAMTGALNLEQNRKQLVMNIAAGLGAPAPQQAVQEGPAPLQQVVGQNAPELGQQPGVVQPVAQPGPQPIVQPMS